jgi:HSP20 family protein
MTRTMTPWAALTPRLFPLESEVPRWLSEMLGPENTGFLSNGAFLPEANVVETDEAVEVAVELPGMKPEDVKVEMKGEKLWITGEKKEEKEEKGKTFHRLERRTGSFRRVFTLPAEVKSEKVEAKFTDGVLHVSLPKCEKRVARMIEVKK